MPNLRINWSQWTPRARSTAKYVLNKHGITLKMEAPKCVGICIKIPCMFTIYCLNAKVIGKEIASEFTHTCIYVDLPLLRSSTFPM